jgi:hypothetical protein
MCSPGFLETPMRPPLAAAELASISNTAVLFYQLNKRFKYAEFSKDEAYG